MTPDELRALADALYFQGRYGHETERQAATRRVEERKRAADYLRRCADAQPVAEVNDRYSRDGYNDEISVLLPVGTKLYTHPAPAAPQAEPFVPHARCKTPDKCRRDGVCFDAWACSSGPAPQAEPIDPHMIAAEDRFPDVPAERWVICSQCDGDFDRECPICDGLGKVLATDGEQAEPKREPSLGELMREQRQSRIVAGAYPDGNPNAGAMMAQTRQAEPKRDQPLLDLLAVIHCDGGHHTEAVGIDQSIKDAQAAVCELKGKLAQAEPKREPLHELPPLPEPGAYAYEWRLQTGSVYRSFSARHYNGVPCDDQVLFFTADQMREYARRAVDIALERAAQECHAQKGGLSSEWGDGHDTGCDDCFAAIRALGKQHD